LFALSLFTNKTTNNRMLFITEHIRRRRFRVLLPYRKKLDRSNPVWCSQLHNHTLFIKKLCEKFGEVRTPRPQWLRPLFYAHDWSFYVDRCLNRTHKIFLYSVSPKITAPALGSPTAGARGICPRADTTGVPIDNELFSTDA